LSDLGGATLGGGMGAGLGATLGPALTALHLGGSSSSLTTTPSSASSAAPEPAVQPGASTPDSPHQSHTGVPHAPPDALGSTSCSNGTPSPYDDAPVANPTQASETWPQNAPGFDMPSWGLPFVPQSGDLGLIFLNQIGCLHVVIQCASLKLPDPDPDQLPRDVVPLRQRVQRLSPNELSATCRLNAALCDRCFVMASFLRKPNRHGQIQSLNLSTRRAHSIPLHEFCPKRA
jgi:hypothetical protein